MLGLPGTDGQFGPGSPVGRPGRSVSAVSDGATSAGDAARIRG